MRALISVVPDVAMLAGLDRGTVIWLQGVSPSALPSLTA